MSLLDTGIAAPAAAATGLPSWLTNMSSDQQLAYYQQLMEQQFPLSVGAPDYSGITATDPGSENAAQNNAFNTAAGTRLKQFMATLSPADQANFQALSDQSESNTSHSMNNLGLLSMATIGLGGGLYGAYGGATTAGTGAATAGAEALPIAAESAPLVTGTGFGTTAAGANLGSSVGASVGGQLGAAAGGDGLLGTGLGYVVPGTGSMAGYSTAQLGAIAAAQTAAEAAGGSLTAAQIAQVAGGVGAAGSAAGGLGGAATPAATSASSQLIPGVSNGQLLTTAGGLLGAAAGSSKGANSATTTNQNTVDPRVAQYLYGANGNGGLLANVNNTMNSQMQNGGLNANQSQGLQMQLDALKNPAYGASLEQMRNTGSGLLGAPMAGNPFTSGQSGTPMQQGAPMPANQPANWQPLQTQLNQRPPGMSSGLLGNLRPYGN